MKDASRIACPKCCWRPTAEDRWECLPRCGTVWNTFWTRGVCPGCSIKWPQTQCHECKRFSPHEAWYREPPDEEADQASKSAEQMDTAADSLPGLRGR